MVVNAERQRTIIHECINGGAPRYCGKCEAHSSHGGKCCFGRLFESGDDDCSRCRHGTDCERLSHSYQPPNRSPWTPGRQPIINQPQQPTLGVRQVTPPNANAPVSSWPPIRPAVQPIQSTRGQVHPYLSPAVPKDDEGLPRFVTRVGVHGALEGAMTFILHLLQMRRPF